VSISYSSFEQLPSTQHPWLRGDGLFETLRVFEGQPVLLHRHLKRLTGSATGLRFDLPDMARVESETRSLASSWRQQSGRLRITLFANCDFLITIEDFSVASASPVKLGISEHLINLDAALTGHKSLSYGANSLALRQAHDSGLSDLVLMNTYGDIVETAIANIYVITEGRVITPALQSGCLPGVARELILEHGWAEESSFPVDTLFNADALFLSSSLKGIVAVDSLSEKGRTKNFVSNPEIEAISRKYEEAARADSRA